MKLTPTQLKILQVLVKQPNGQGQIGGDRRVHFHKSAESLVRRGLLRRPYSSWYVITEEGKAVLREIDQGESYDG